MSVVTTRVESQQSLMEAGLVGGIVSLLVVSGLVAIWFWSSLPQYLTNIQASSKALSHVHALLGRVAWYRRLGVGIGVLVGSALSGGPSFSLLFASLGFAVGSVGAGLMVRSSTDMTSLPAWFSDLISERVIWEPAILGGLAILSLALNGLVIWLIVALAARRNLDLGQRRRPLFPAPGPPTSGAHA